MAGGRVRGYHTHMPTTTPPQRTALVTGAGRRLGLALALGLADDGFAVAFHYHTSGQAARDAADGVRERGGSAVAIEADLTDPTQCEALAGRVVDALGSLDVLVNSAACFPADSFGETTAAAWDDVFALNVRAPFLLSQAAAPYLSQGETPGRIVNIGDVAAFSPWASRLPYSVSKAALHALTVGLAKTLAPQVLVNALAPGRVLPQEDPAAPTDESVLARIGLGRLGKPQDVVAAMRLLVLGSDFITGAVIPIDGFTTPMPSIGYAPR